MRLIKLLFLFFIFSVLYINTYALNVEINTDKNEISVGETFNLSIQIEGNLSGNFDLGEIKGFENFDIVNRSESQSSASKIVIINGNRKIESKTIYNINYTLEAKKKGEFVIGPISLSNSGSNIITNPVNIKVGGGSTLLGNHSNYKNNFIIRNDKIEKGEVINDDKKENYLTDIFIITKNIFFIIFAIIPLFILFYYFKNKEKFVNLNIEKLKGKIFKYKNKEQEEEDYKDDKILKIEEIKDESIIEEEKKVTEEIYPNIDDNDFLLKLENIFRNKLKNKYKIENIKNKTYVDILSEIENIEFYDKEKIKMLSNLFNKAKYSNIGLNKKELEELLELVKKI